MIQYKSIKLEIKDISLESREVAAYFSAFNNTDSDKEIIRQGAFSKSISERFERIKHLYNHWDTVGKFKSLTEDSKGLLGVTKIGRHTLGNDVLMMYEDGIITEHSIGFETILDRPLQTADGSIRELIELRLWEGSSLDKWGANDMTPVMGVNGKDLKQYTEAIDKLTKALKHGKYTDETMQEFEIKLKNIQSFLLSLTNGVAEPITTPPTEPKGIDFEKLITIIN